MKLYLPFERQQMVLMGMLRRGGKIGSVFTATGLDRATNGG